MKNQETPAIKHSYGYQSKLEIPPAEAVKRTVEALKNEGFGVLTEINMK